MLNQHPEYGGDKWKLVVHFTIYDFRLDKNATDERTLAQMHLDKLKELGLNDALLLFDRWHPSKEFIAYALTQSFVTAKYPHVYEFASLHAKI
ncbi:MAG: hypothetical protein RR816_00320, partial [Clostridia bacterium]